MSGSVDVAFKYGPFFFGIFLVGTAIRLVKKGDLSRGLAWLFSLSGILFMAVSVQWWMRRPAIHVFEGVLHNLKPYELLTSDDLTFFYREEPKTKMGDDDIQLRNVRFAVVKEGDFAPADSFSIEYRKNGGPRESFRIPYSAGKQPEFTIEWDAAAQKNVLKAAATVAVIRPRSHIFERLAFAEPAAFVAPVERARDPSFTPPRSASDGVGATAKQAGSRQPAPAPAPRPRGILSPDAASQVAVLQDSRSEVGAKIGALDRLLTYDPVGIGVLMQAATDEGPVAGTLLDLSRHSDPELASKARALLDRAGDLTAIVAKDLASRDPLSQANAKALLGSMDPAEAVHVLKPLSPSERKILAPPSVGQPLPTGSRSGDRYYVKAAWDPQAQSVVTCLTSFYNGFLLSSRSLADERRMMQGRSSRLVYGFTRDQALYAADQIRGCGGKPTFVAPDKAATFGE